MIQIVKISLHVDNQIERRGVKSKKRNRGGGGQLKLPRSVIINLERKVEEIDNSNNILRKEMNLFKSNNEKPSNDGTYQLNHGLNSSNTNQTYQRHNNGSNLGTIYFTGQPKRVKFTNSVIFVFHPHFSM